MRARSLVSTSARPLTGRSASPGLLALRFAAGLTTPEIAATLGKRPEAVRKSLSRLLQSLKEQYHAAH